MSLTVRVALNLNEIEIHVHAAGSNEYVVMRTTSRPEARKWHPPSYNVIIREQSKIEPSVA